MDIHIQRLEKIDSQVNTNAPLARFPRIAIGPNGEIYLAWLRYTSLGNGEIRIKKSVNGGESFPQNFTSIPINALKGDLSLGKIKICSYPAIAVDQNTGYVYVAWTSYDTGGDCNIRYARSIDGGQTFSTMGIATFFTENKQCLPALSVDPAGKVVLTYVSNHDNPSYIDVLMTESFDKGVSFTHPDMYLTSWSPNNNNPLYGSGSYYQGIASVNGCTYPVWEDYNHSDSSDIYNSRINRIPTSNSGVATAYGCTPKMIYSTRSNRFNAIYQSNDGIFYMYSTDDGSTWNDHIKISGTTGGMKDYSNPTLFEDESGNLHVLFISDNNGIYYLKKTFGGSWTSPRRIYQSSDSRYPTLTVDANGIGHVVFVNCTSGTLLAPVVRYDLYYGNFNTADPVSNLTIQKLIYFNTTVNSLTIKGTSLIQLSNGQLHTVWSVSGEIYYSYGSGSNWSTALNISNNSGNSEYPSITCRADDGANFLLRVVWQDKTPGNYEIFSRLCSSGWWPATENISNNTGQSKYPIVKKSDYFAVTTVVMWSDNTGNTDPNNYDIWYQEEYEYYATHKLIPTTQPSMYPSFSEHSIQNGMRYVVTWTEGTSLPFKILSDTLNLNNPFGKRSISMRSNNIIPTSYELFQNYPNPFNPMTTIYYGLPENAYVELKIYDLIGREVKTVVNGMQDAGYKLVSIDASDLPSGLYFYRMQAGKFSNVKKMILLR